MSKKRMTFTLSPQICRVLRMFQKWGKTDPEAPHFTMSNLVEKGLKREFLAIARGLSKYDEELENRYAEYLENRQQIADQIKKENPNSEKIDVLRRMDKVLADEIIDRVEDLLNEAIEESEEGDKTMQDAGEQMEFDDQFLNHPVRN